VVFRDLAIRDDLRLPWRDIQWALRRLEDRGLVRGGRFVAGFNGEQYALPTAIEQLDHVRKSPRTGERVTVNATDPLNLVGVIVPGATVASVRTNHVVFVDGVPEDGPSKAAPGPGRGTDRGTGGDLAGSGPPTPDRVAARVVWAGSP
jgi:ATP-dependent Lhr-like helicase